MQKDSQTVRQQHLISANIFRVVLIGLRIRKQAACRELEKKEKKEKVCVRMDASSFLLAGESLWAL